MITASQLNEAALRYGFNHVIDAFHNVNNSVLAIKFYEKNYHGNSRKIILTDELYSLSGKDSLNAEAESRWHLVETAWALSIPVHMLNVRYDYTSTLLYMKPDSFTRKNITPARDALNGYQKGKCFYCGENITLSSCDIEHFFPYVLQPEIMHINLNGIWNLVLSCRECNRKKSTMILSEKFLLSLYHRNEFLIQSHHPLRETLINQTGRTSAERRDFLNRISEEAKALRRLRRNVACVHD